MFAANLETAGEAEPAPVPAHDRRPDPGRLNRDRQGVQFLTGSTSTGQTLPAGNRTAGQARAAQTPAPVHNWLLILTSLTG